MKFKNILYRLLISPKSTDPDGRRQELILNIIIVSLLTGSLFALAIATVNALSSDVTHYANTYVTTLAFTGFIGFILFISRQGHFRAGSLIFLSLLVIVTGQLLLAWGYMLQIVLLLEILIIVVTGILFSARWGLIVSVIITIITVAVGLSHQSGLLKPDLSWQGHPYIIGDAIGFSVIFLVVGLLTWLSNREIGYSLKRARASEHALGVERDNLEDKVIKRTKQLEETQLIRLMELQKFAEFGRLNANLLHEIGNPLTAAKLNIELVGKNMPNPILQVNRNLKQMERYLEAARSQINGTASTTNFSVDNVIKQVMSMPEDQTHKEGLVINYEGIPRFKLKGDAIKFNQLIRNLLSNAIESYVDVHSLTANRQISISLEQFSDFLTIRVRDFGKGLTKDQISHIFEPFYTTKLTDKRNLGLGLVMVKRFVDEDFKGTIKVSSSKSEGTLFTVNLKIR